MERDHLPRNMLFTFDLLFQEVFTCGEGPPPKEHAVYSDQLEQSWMTDSHFQVQVPRKLHRLKLGEYMYHSDSITLQISSPILPFELHSYSKK